MPDYSEGIPVHYHHHHQCFLTTPAARISAWTGLAGPEAAHVLRARARVCVCDCVCLSRSGYFRELETRTLKPEMRVWLLSVYFQQS